MKLYSVGILGLLLFLFGCGDWSPEPTPVPAPAPSAPSVTLQGSVDGTMAYCSIGTGEAIVGRDTPEEEGAWWSAWSGEADPLAAARASVTPDRVTALTSLPTAGIAHLRVDARLSGVAVEAVEGDSFQLSYVGVDHPESFPVTTKVENGLLTVTVHGAEGQFYYVNSSPEGRANTLRIGVPAGVLSSITLDCSTANLLVSGLDVPVVCDTTNAMVLVRDEHRTAPLAMTCTNGSLGLSATSAAGDVSLSAANGSVWLEVEEATGKMELTAQNGSVKARAGALQDARLQAQNGSVKASVGTISGQVYAGVKNGSLDFHLTQAPADLTFRGQGRNLLNALPHGWSDGCVFGDGGPVLELEGISGEVTFAVG